MARPTKYNEDRAATICKYIAAGGNREDSAMAAGISVDTLYAWQRRYPQFYQKVMEAEAGSVIVTERAAQKKDPVRWLQAKRPLIWGNLGKTTVEHTGADGAPIAHRVTIEPDADAITAAADALRAAALAAGVADPTE